MDTRDHTDARPPRRAAEFAATERVARIGANANLDAMRAAGDAGRRDFIQMRSPTGVVRMALTHTPIFAELVRLWQERRVRGDADPGVATLDLATALGVSTQSLGTALASLRRNLVIRTKSTYVGYQGHRSLHYPTESGSKLLAIAELLGPGTMVTTGGRVRAWRGRNQSEPGDLFQFAALLRGAVNGNVERPVYESR